MNIIVKKNFESMFIMKVELVLRFYILISTQHFDICIVFKLQRNFKAKIVKYHVEKFIKL